MKDTKYTPESILDMRKKIGLSQREFANRLKCSYRTVQDWERGINKPSRWAKSAIDTLEESIRQMEKEHKEASLKINDIIKKLNK